MSWLSRRIKSLHKGLGRLFKTTVAENTRRTAKEHPTLHGSQPLPLGTDWFWRPPLWSEVLAEIPGISAANEAEPEQKTLLDQRTSLFHDCPKGEITVIQSQVANTPPCSVNLEIGHFDGHLLSLIIDFPPKAVNGLTLSHIIRLEVNISTQKPLQVFAQLNVKHGPNHTSIPTELEPCLQTRRESLALVGEFDLAHSGINIRHKKRMWLDVIFSAPKMKKIFIHDLTLSRHPRAAL